MAFWIKTGLWVAALVLPGGLLLLPVIYAMHRRDARRAPGAGRDAVAVSRALD